MGLEFRYYAIILYILWGIGSILCIIDLVNRYLRKKKTNLFPISITFMFLGLAFLVYYIVILWINLERPPIRTLGETRLWYSFYMSGLGIFISLRYRMKWMILITTFFSFLFLTINFLHPD